MNRKEKVLTTLAVIISLTLCFAGCSNSASAGISNSSAEKEKINIEDISWSVDEGIVDGDRYVLLNYANNTEYTITDFEITFKEKGDISDEEKANFYSDIQ